MDDSETPKVPMDADPRDYAAILFGVRPEEIEDDATILNQRGWDSFAHLDLMMYLSERYGIEISEETIELYSSISTIEDLHMRRDAK